MNINCINISRKIFLPLLCVEKCSYMQTSTVLTDAWRWPKIQFWQINQYITGLIVSYVVQISLARMICLWIDLFPYSDCIDACTELEFSGSYWCWAIASTHVFGHNLQQHVVLTSLLACSRFTCETAARCLKCFPLPLRSRHHTGDMVEKR